MKIAILGAGFSGLAVAWHLLQDHPHEIVIFDSLKIAQGTSGIAAGLMHPYAGLHAKKSFRAEEGMAASQQLFQVAESALNLPIILHRGLIRLAVTDSQKEDFSLTASHYSDVHWLTAEESQERLQSIVPHPGIFIDSAIAVHCENYLKGLAQACVLKGACFEQKAISCLQELSGFDRIVVAMGAATKTLPELQHLKITPIKGQVLEFNWPSHLIPLAAPISSQAYLVMQENNQKCLVGATFERHFDKTDPDLHKALDEILPKIHPFLPELNQKYLIGCRAGVRSSAPQHLPIAEKINDKTWVLTGMGSKGLLYHALYAKELVEKIKFCR